MNAFAVNICLHDNLNFRFHAIDNDQLIAYSKISAEKNSTLVMIVNLDPELYPIRLAAFTIRIIGDR